MATYSALQKSRAIAISALVRKKAQTLLTMSGMAVGVATVLTTVALGSGAEKAVQDQVRAAGMNVVTVTSGNYRMQQQWTSDGETDEQQTGLNQQPEGANPVIQKEENDPESSAGLGASNRLSFDDAEAIRKLEGVQFVSAGVVDNARVVIGDDGWFTRMHGETAHIAKIRRAWSMRYGRFFSEREVARGDDVAVVGSVVGEHLFGGRNPVGTVVTAKGRKFKVIGEIASSSWMVPAAEGDDQFDAIYIPVTTAQSVMHRKNLDTITVSTASTGEVSRVSREVTAVLRRNHRLVGNEANDFVVASEARKSLTKGGMRTDVARAVIGNVQSFDQVTLEQLGKTLDHASRTMTALLAGVAVVSLVVGGIGIMNIMLLSVTERTREIGVRRAVGARSNEVMLQFLMEAVLLSLVGGVCGIVVGVAAAAAISSLVQWAVWISPWSVALAFGISSAIGTLFGYYPARKASQVSPMTSLRYE